MFLATVLRYFRQVGPSLAAILLCTAPCYPLGVGPATAAVTKPNPGAEQWVRAQIDAGKVADLSSRFSKPADQVLSATFLEQLLTDSSQSVKIHRHGINIRHAVFIEDIDLRNVKIAYPISLEGCRFDKDVNLANSVFEKDISFSRSSFKTANFRNMKVGGAAVFDEAVFASQVDFGEASIANNFEADNAKFTNPEEEANFNGMKVGHIAFFRKAEFAGSVDFIGADIASQFQAHKAQFTNPKKKANFNHMKVGHYAVFDEAVFAGPVNFGGANVARNFEADNAQFINPEQEVTFNGMKVGHTAFFNEAVFAGPVDFVGADIASNFEAVKARFTNPKQETTFNHMKVGHTTFFNEAVFAGPVDLQQANFHNIVLSDVIWPKMENSIKLQGMAYHQISASQESDSLEKLLALIDQSAYSTNVYGTLEDFFKREGQSGYANDTFIAQKWRERREALRWYTFDYWWNWVLYLLVAYGRRPEQAIAWSMLFVGVGCWVFRRPENMEAQKAEYESETYSPFWYSVGLFLPFVNLHAAEVWRPKNECTRARIYMRVHILLGWILVPIGLVSLTGLIK